MSEQEQGRGRMELIPFSKIRIKSNVRQDMGDLSELAATFVGGEPIHPPTVVPNEDGTYTLVAGERRFQAMLISGLTRASFHVAPGLANANLSLLQLVENLARKALNPLEEARAYESLLPEYGDRQDHLAQAVGVSPSTISRRLALLETADPVKGLIEDGVLRASHAEEIADAGLTAEEQVEVAETLKAKPKVTVGTVKAAVTRIKKDRENGHEPSDGEEDEAERWVEGATGESRETRQALESLEAHRAQECSLYRRLYEDGADEAQVQAYQTMQQSRNEIMDISENVTWTSPETANRVHSIALFLQDELADLAQRLREAASL